jgi:hypothetical protein
MEDLILPAYLLQFVSFALIEDKWKIYVGLRTNAHINTGKHRGLHIRKYFFPYPLRLLVPQSLDLHFIFKITSKISEKFTSTIVCSSFVVILISSLFPSISSSYLVGIIYACVLLFTVFIISIMSSNTLTSA